MADFTWKANPSSGSHRRPDTLWDARGEPVRGGADSGPIFSRQFWEGRLHGEARYDEFTGKDMTLADVVTRKVAARIHMESSPTYRPTRWPPWHHRPAHPGIVQEMIQNEYTRQRGHPWSRPT